uniref:Uncharacterized protein n=1 Tax=Setaria digitata TaxID=48799 RepID=A0A915PYD0_9BILA
MEKAIDSVKTSQLTIKKMDRSALKRKISKIDKLVRLYKQLRGAIIKLENREVSFGANYNEEFEEACNKRLLKLMQKRLQIHSYLVRKGIFVSDTGETLHPDVKPKLIITSTGVEDLNTLLTEYVNQETNSELFGYKTRILYKHVTVNDVKIMVDKLKETNNAQLFPNDPVKFDQLIQNIACEVNKLVKQFIEDTHKKGLADWAALGSASESENFPSTSSYAYDAESREEHSLAIPTWDTANMELHEACGRGELDCTEPENSGDIDDTGMSPTAEDDEDEEEEGCESDIQYNVPVDSNIDGTNRSADTESDESCCIVGERVHERCDENDDSDCRIIEDEEQTMSNEGIVNEDIENIEQHLAANAEYSAKKEKKKIDLDEKVVNDDDDCCIIED